MSQSKREKLSRRYCKKELTIAKQNRDVKVLQELVQRIHNGEKMSVAETEFACSALRATKAEGDISFVNIGAIPACQDFIFRNLYISYFQDLEGKYGIEKFTGLVSMEEKREDVIRLNEYYKDWEKVVSSNRHSENLLNLVINEISKDLKYIRKLHEKGQINDDDYEYKRKSIVLHSKYLYLTAKAFFDEYQSDSVVCLLHGKKIEINEHSLVHILNRHMAGAAKQFDTGKSFHLDRRIKWFELPTEVKEIIERLGTNDETKEFKLEYIPFKLNGVIYGIWTKPHVKHVQGKRISYQRLETFYPIESEKDLTDIQNNYNEVIIDDTLIAYMKKP
jgi:hypothetical protein